MISIIIPAYNAADYLAQTIESVLNQTYSDFELILIDDGSTDRTREIIKDYQCKDARIKYFYKENGGVSSARNLGLQKATGDFVSFLDSDDLWDRRFLESMYHKLVAGGELACFCGYIEKRGGYHHEVSRPFWSGRRIEGEVEGRFVSGFYRLLAHRS